MTTTQQPVDTDIDLALDEPGTTTTTPWAVISWLSFAFMLLAVIVTGLNRNNPDVVGAAAIAGVLFGAVSLLTGREAH